MVKRKEIIARTALISPASIPSIMSTENAPTLSQKPKREKLEIALV
jgi:hypothetical protein